MNLNNYRILSILLPFSVMAITACTPTPDAIEEANRLLAVDVEFSRRSEEIGGHKAFLDYIDDSAVMLRANHYPIVGRANIEKMFQNRSSDFTLTWEPLFATVSSGGDMGYTYGVYKSRSVSANGEPVVNEGTYVTIWKKDAGGAWKFVLDTGNPGLGQKKPNLEQASQ